MIRRLLVTLAAIALAAGCVAPDETTTDEETPATGEPTPPTAGLDETNQTGVPEGDAGTVGAPGPDAEYAPPDYDSS